MHAINGMNNVFKLHRNTLYEKIETITCVTPMITRLRIKMEQNISTPETKQTFEFQPTPETRIT